MGWLFYHRERGTSDRDHFQTKLAAHHQILDSATIRNVFYAAVRDTRTAEITAMVCLIRRCRGDLNFGYKDMDESSGPVEDACPTRILDLLTDPPPNDWAAQWRARCRARAARPPVHRGDVIVFTRPLRFTDGTEAAMLRYLTGSTFTRPDGTGRYHVSGWRDLDYRHHDLAS